MFHGYLEELPPQPSIIATEKTPNTMKKQFLLAVLSAIILAGCSSDRSEITGWAYNDPRNGGFEKVPYAEQETGPNLVLIEGGTFTMGRVEQDVQYDWNNIPRRVTCLLYTSPSPRDA